MDISERVEKVQSKIMRVRQVMSRAEFQQFVYELGSRLQDEAITMDMEDKGLEQGYSNAERDNAEACIVEGW